MVGCQPPDLPHRRRKYHLAADRKAKLTLCELERLQIHEVMYTAHQDRQEDLRVEQEQAPRLVVDLVGGAAYAGREEEE